MKALKLKGKSKAELQKILRDYRDKIRKIRFSLVSGKVKNYKKIGEIKRDIARVLTILRSNH